MAIPIPTNTVSWNEMLRRVSRSFRARPASFTENVFINASVAAFRGDYPGISWRFFGKTGSGKLLAKLGQFIDDTGAAPLAINTQNALETMFNNLDYARYVR